MYLNFTGFNYTHLTNALKNGEIQASNLTQNQLKYFQILAITLHDDTLAELNVSVPTDDLVERLDDFQKLLQKHLSWRYVGIRANWTEKYEVNLTQTFGPNSLCYTFNFPGAAKFFHLEKLAKDFNFSKVYPLFMDPTKKASLTVFEYPLKTTDYQLGLDIAFDYRIFNGNVKTFNEIQAQLGGNMKEFLNFSHPSKVQDGYKLILHDPFEVPSPESHQFFTIPHEIYEIEITPEITKFDESIKDYSPEERNCYFDGEKELKFLKVYSKINCEHECLAVLFLNECSCAPFYTVRDTKTRICGYLDNGCVKKVETKFLSMKSDCKCFDPCENIKYIYHTKMMAFQMCELLTLKTNSKI